MNIKLIITDIDGTLIGDSLEVDYRTKQAIRFAQQRGVAVAAATGRMLPSAMNYVHELDIHGPVISYNGALIADSITSEVIYKRTIPLELAREVFKLAESEGAYAQYYDERNYYMQEHCRESEAYFKHAGIRGIAVGGNPAKDLDTEPLKILLIFDSVEKTDRVNEKALNIFGGSLEIVKSMPMFIDFTHPQANKGTAIKELVEHMGIDIKSVMAIGDGLNDISMLKQAGIGIAIGNAHQSVKNAADYVTANQEDYGVAKVIEKFVLKEK